MSQFRKFARVALLAAIVAVSFQGIVPRSTRADDPKKAATQPAVERPGLGEIDVADYCIVLLAPKLRTQLGASDAQRETLEDLNTKLRTRLDNCATATMPGLNPNRITPGTISARMKLQLAEFGRQVRDALTPEQDKRLVDLFNKKTLTPITVSVSIDTETPRFGPNAGKVYRSTSYQLNYTHFGEVDGNDAAAPAALPKANTPAAAAEGTAAGVGRARSRPDRPGKPADGNAPAAAVSLVTGDELPAGRMVRLPTRNAVKHLAASADGKLLVTAEDQVIRLWDCTGGNPADVAEMDSQALHLGNIRAIALSPDASMLAIGGDDKSVRLYSLANFELKRLDTQISHDSGLWTVAFSPDGKSVISGADDLNVIWWNVNNGKLEEKSRIKIPSIFGIKYLAVQPKQIVTCSTGAGDVATIDFSAAEPVVKASYKIQPSPFCLPMAMSPADGTLLFGGGHNVQLKGASSRAFSTSTKDIKCVAWSPDGKFFATGTDDGHLLVWDSTGKIRHDFIRPTRFNEIAFLAPPLHSNDLVIAGANDDAEVYVLRLKTDAAAKKNGPGPE